MRTDADPIPALKQQLRDELMAIVGMWEPSAIATAIGTDRPRMSDLERNKLERFSLESLIRFVTRMECRVEVKVVRLSLCPRIFIFDRSRKVK